MSGLLQFFQNFSPTGETDIDSGSVQNYCDSITKKAAVIGGEDNSNEVPMDGNEVGEQRGDPEKGGRNLFNDENPEYTDEPLTYHEWRDRRNELLTRFLMQRLFSSDDDNEGSGSDTDSDETEDVVEDLDDSDEIQHVITENPMESQQEGQRDPESQQLLHPETQQDQQLLPHTAMEHKKNIVVPHVDAAVHDVSLLEDVDLFCRQATITLSLASKVFGLRNTRRFAATQAFGPRFQPILRGSTANSNALPRLANDPVECDGPLSTVYKQCVLNVDVSQLNVAALNPARRRHNRSDQFQEDDSKSKKNMRIFFYDAYANVLNKCLEAYDPKSHILLFRLERIPAVCVFPYANQHWLHQQHLAEWCFCVGGPSAMKITDDSGLVMRPRFDSNDLKIVVAIGDKVTGTFDEFVISNSHSGPELQQARTLSLPLTYRQWQQRWNMPVLEGENNEASMVDDAEAVKTTQEQTVTCEKAPPCIQQQHAAKLQRSNPASQSPHGLPKAKRPKATANQYTFMKDLRQLLESHRVGQSRSRPCEANIYSVVIGFGGVKQTNKGDWMMNVTLLDDTCGESTDIPIPLIIFCQHRNHLPDLRRAGDVLRLHRVRVQEYKEGLQLMAQRSTGFTVYRESSDSFCFDPGAVFSPGKFTLGAGDGRRFHSLSKWGAFCLAHKSTIKISEQRTLGQVLRQDDAQVGRGDTEQDFIGDFTVMVTAILPFPRSFKTDITPYGFLRVWDGTGPSVSDCYPTPELAPQRRQDDPPSETLIAISKIKECRDNRKPLIIPDRLCGRVVNVAVWEEPHWDTVTIDNNVKIGDFIRLRNVQEHFITAYGRCLIVAASSWLTPVPPRTFEVLDLLTAHSQRISKNHAINPSSGVLPLDAVRNHDAQTSENPNSATSLSESDSGTCTSLIQLIRKRAGSTFVGELIIQGTVPFVSCLGDVTKLCQMTKTSEVREYRFALSLKDESVKKPIMAIVSDAMGDKLFGIAASEVCAANGKDSGAVVLAALQKGNLVVKLRSILWGGAKFFLLLDIDGE